MGRKQCLYRNKKSYTEVSIYFSKISWCLYRQLFFSPSLLYHFYAHKWHWSSQDLINDQPLFDVFGNRLLENLWDNYVCCYFTRSDITISLIHSHHYITLLIQWKKKNLHVKPILSLKKSKISLLLKIPKI